MSAPSITGLKGTTGVRPRARSSPSSPKTLGVLEVTQCVWHIPKCQGRMRIMAAIRSQDRGDRLPLPGLADAGAVDPSYRSLGRV